MITVEATDSDIGSFGVISYAITAGNPNKFFMDPQLGRISVLTFLDREGKDSYVLTVEAVDGGPAANDSTRRTGTTTVTINVLDTNDNKPTLDQPSYVQTILTNHSLLTAVLQANCSDPDLSPPPFRLHCHNEGLVNFAVLPTIRPGLCISTFMLTCHDMEASGSQTTSVLVTIVSQR